MTCTMSRIPGSYVHRDCSCYYGYKNNKLNLTDYGWLEIDEDATGNVLASSSLTEEGVEGVVTTSNGLV